MISETAIAIKCHLKREVLPVNYVACCGTSRDPTAWLNDRKYQIRSLIVVLLDGQEILVYSWKECVGGHQYRYQVVKQFNLSDPNSIDLLIKYCKKFRFLSFLIKILSLVFPSNWFYRPLISVVDFGDR